MTDAIDCGPIMSASGGIKPRISARVQADLSESAIYNGAYVLGCYPQDIIAVRAAEASVRIMAELNGRRHALGMPPIKFEPIHPDMLKMKGVMYWEVEAPAGIYWSNPTW